MHLPAAGTRRTATAAACLGMGSVLLLAAPPAPAVPARATASGPAVVRAGGSLVPGTTCPAFPASNFWNTPVTHARRDRRSATWVAAIGTGNLHPDFGPALGEQSVPYGIPVTVVTGSHPRVPLRFEYAEESDPGPYPLGPDTRIEGGPEASGDRHAIVVDASTCTLYETWDTHESATGWRAGSGATWNLRANRLRPRGWTSADAAGLPILPGLLTYDEVTAGRVTHALRFTAARTADAFIWPGRHRAGTGGSNDPPLGARFRLRADFDMTGWSAQAQVVLRGMRTYGLVLADNGAPWFVQGTADERWPQDLVDELKSIPATAFEAVNTARMRVSPNSGRARNR